MGALYREVNDDGTISTEQRGNMPGTVETERGVAGDYSPHGYAPSGTGLEPVRNLGQSAFNLGLTNSSGPVRGLLSSPYGSFAPVTDLQEQARLEQMRLIQDLQRQAAGDPNSMAQQQLRQGYGAAQAQQSSLGSTMRGQSAGAAMRGISQGQQGIQRGYAGDQQMLMAQEQQAAQAMLSQLLAQQRGQDAGWQQGLSGITNGRDAARNFYDQFVTGQLYGLDRGERDSNLEMARTKLGLDLEQRTNDRGMLNNLVNGAATTAGSIYSMGGNQNAQAPRNSQAPLTDTLMQSNPDEWANPFPYR